MVRVLNPWVLFGTLVTAQEEPEMDKDVQELNRSMDTTFDSLFVLNATVNAIMQALPADSANQVAQSLDEVLGEMSDHLGEDGRKTLLAWRNTAARRAGLPCKRS
jgi:hypothetical protein